MIKYSDYGKSKHKFTSSTNNFFFFLTHSLLSPERSPRDNDDHRDGQYLN